jgi:hypothetical protein
MLAIMFDLHFKSFQVVENYVGHGDCICLVSKYDANVIIPFLTMVFEVLLNHIVQTCVMTIDGLVVGCNDFIKGNNIFGVSASMENLCVHFLFGNCFIQEVICNFVVYVKPLVWWYNHERRFPNICFFAKQILGISGSQVGIERVFNFFSVLTILRCCKLQVKILDCIIIVVKN